MVTRNDVAKHAGVSSATVSRVMNGSDKVKDDLRARVEASIKALGYKPNLTAKRLRSQKTYQIAYIIPDIMNPYFTEIYKGLVDVFDKKDYTCHLIEHSTIKSADFYQGFDGLIVSGGYWKDVEESCKLPMIIQSRPVVIDHDYYAFIYHNTDEVLVEAFNYMYNKGHRRIGMITRDVVNNYREGIYKSFHELKGMKVEAGRMISYSSTNYHYDQGYKTMNELLNNDPKVSAVICQNDLIALGAMCAARDRGYRVPEDMSFIGNDDSVVAKYSQPRLTTIKLYKKQQGLKAAQMLLDLIANNTTENQIFNGELIIRDSVSDIIK